MRERVYKVYSGMVSRAKPRYFKSGKRMGQVSRHGIDKLPFTREQLWKLALEQVGSGVILCPYCVAIGRNAFSIDLGNAVFDHKEPLAVTGITGWRIDNLVCICTDCNGIKGNMSYECFVALMQHIEAMPPESHDRKYLLRCLRTHGLAQQFQRGIPKKSGRGTPKPPPPLYHPPVEDF